MIQTIFGYLALGLSLGGLLPYIIDTLRGNTKPARISWFVWMLLGLVYVYTAVVENGAVVFTLAQLIGPTAIFILSLKYGVGGKDKVDIAMLMLALIAIVLLLLTEDTLASLLLAIFADGIAILVTIKKLLKDRSSESRLSWSILAISSVFALMSLEVFNFETMALPIFLITVSVVIVAISKPAKTQAVAVKE